MRDSRHHAANAAKLGSSAHFPERSADRAPSAPDEGDLRGHALARVDLAPDPLVLEEPPGGVGEPLEEKVDGVDRSDRAVEVAQDLERAPSRVPAFADQQIEEVVREIHLLLGDVQRRREREHVLVVAADVEHEAERAAADRADRRAGPRWNMRSASARFGVKPSRSQISMRSARPRPSTSPISGCRRWRSLEERRGSSAPFSSTRAE